MQIILIPTKLSAEFFFDVFLEIKFIEYHFKLIYRESHRSMVLRVRRLFFIILKRFKTRKL